MTRLSYAWLRCCCKQDKWEKNQDKEKSDAGAIPSWTLWRMPVVRSGQMKANVLSKVSSSSPSAAWTGLTPAEKAADPEMQHQFHILSTEDGQRTNFFCHHCSLSQSVYSLSGREIDSDYLPHVNEFKVQLLGSSSSWGHSVLMCGGHLWRKPRDAFSLIVLLN